MKRISAVNKLSSAKPHDSDRHPVQSRLSKTPLALLIRVAMMGTVAVAATGFHVTAWGQSVSAERKTYDLPASTLEDALNRFSRQAGITLSFDPALVQGRNVPALKGSYSVQEGLGVLLNGSHLQAVRAENGTFGLRVLPVVTGAETTLPAVNVTAATLSDLPPAYAGGQVARGGRVGILGDKDFMDTPFNVTTYTAQTIQDQQARTIADIVNNNPSLRAIYPDNDVNTDFIVRGNKIKALDAAYGGMYGLMSPGVEALERVEIISGANALLNGLGPVGGVGGSINQVPKRALETPLTRLTTSYISDSQYGLQADISRRFGPDNRVGVRFNGLYSDGNTSVQRQGKKVVMGALALDYRGSDVRLSADIGYRENDSTSPSRTTFVAGGFNLPAPPKSGNSWQQPWSYENVNALTGALRGEVDLSPDVTAYAGIGASKFQQAQLFANSFLTSAAGALTQVQVYWPLYRDSVTAEAGLRGKLTTGAIKHNWTVSTSGLQIKNGILLNNLALTNTNIYTPVFITQPSIAGLAHPGSVPKTSETNLFGIAVADTLSTLDDRLQLTIGLRYQSVKSENFNPTTGVTLPPSYDKSATTPGVGLIFKVANNISLYANYIEGLQQGPTNLGQVFAPYISKQYEAGAKFDFGTFATTISAYQLKTPNGYNDPVTNTFGIYGEQRTQGIELNTFGEIVRGIRLLGGLALVDAKQTKTRLGINDGKQVTGAPKVQLNLGTEWDVAASGLTLSARAIHTSSQYIDLANTQPVPSWTRYDVGARYKTKLNGTPTTIRLNVQNVADKSYWASAIEGYLVQSTPRTFLLSASFDF